MENTYYLPLAAAFVRGRCITDGTPTLPDPLRTKALPDLAPEELREIFRAGQEAGLKMYYFKSKHDDLPRVKKVLGFLRGIPFDSLLDVGSGRGVFLFPFLNAFPWVQTTTVDILPHRTALMEAVSRGGVANLTAVNGNICEGIVGERSVDVVTLLEVLEHIPDVGTAVKAAVRTARRYVVVSVPSHEDDNPEHIHLLTKDKLTALFREAGCTRLHFDGVNGHLLLFAALDEL